MSVTAAVTSTPDGDAQHRHGAARQQRPGRAERQDVVHDRDAEHRPASATSMYAPAPTASATSTSATGRTRRIAATCPAA
jgi:hypothetical protein